MLDCVYMGCLMRACVNSQIYARVIPKGMIKVGYPEKILILAVGTVLSIIGMADFTGIIHLGSGNIILYLGYAIAFIGLVLVFMDYKQNYALLDEYGAYVDAKKRLDAAPEDDYLVDLCGTEAAEPDTELTDLTNSTEETEMC